MVPARLSPNQLLGIRGGCWFGSGAICRASNLPTAQLLPIAVSWVEQPSYDRRSQPFMMSLRRVMYSSMEISPLLYC